MGVFSDVLRSVENQRGPEPETIPDSLRKGFDSGMKGAGSQLNSLAGLAGENLGFGEFAAARNADAQRLQQEAQQLAPAVQSYKQVNSLRTGGNYVAGLIGGSAPVMGAGLVGGLATGGAGAIPAMLGAAAATAPFEIGDVIQKQNADPEAMQATPGARLRDAAFAGGASALAQGIVPGAVAGKIAGRGVGGVLKSNLAAIPVEGVAEGGGEAIKQFGANQDKPFDTDAILENAVGGAAAGGAFGAVGAGADFVRGAAPGAREALGSAAGALEARLKPSKEEPGTPVDDAKPTSGFQSAWNNLQDLAGMGKTKLDDSVKRVKEGIPLGDLKEFGTAQGQRLSDMTDFSASEGLKKATQWGEEMLNDAGLTPERRQAVTEAMSKVGDRAGQMAMAGLKEAQDRATETMGKIKAFHESAVGLANLTGVTKDVEGAVKSAKGLANLTGVTRSVDDTVRSAKGLAKLVGAGTMVDDAKSALGIKKSEDLRGATEAVVREIVPMLKTSNSALVEDAKGINMLADGLVSTIKAMQQGPLSSDRIARLIDLLGDDTNRVLVKLDEMFGAKDPAKVEAFFKQVQDIDGVQKRTDNLDQLVRSSLTPEAQDTMLSSDVPKVIEMLRSITRGHLSELGEKSARGTLLTSTFREAMVNHFGAAADRVSKAFEKEAKLHGTDLGADKYNEDGSPVNPEAMDVITKGRGNKNEPVMHPDLFKANNAQGQNYGAQYLLDMARDYPDRQVRFEYAEGSTTHGHVVAEKAANVEELSNADMTRMRLDTDRFANSPDRLQLGKDIFDTRRIAKTMEAKIKNRSSFDEQSKAHRLARMFNEGIAQLMEHYGRRIKVADDMVIGTIGGKDFTYGEARKLTGNTTQADRTSDAEVRSENALRITQRRANDVLEKALASGDKEKIEEAKNSVANIEAQIANHEETVGANRSARKDYELSRDENFERDDESEPDVGKDDEIHKAASKLKGDELLHKVNMDGSGHTADKRIPTYLVEPAKELDKAIRGWAKSEPAKKIAARAKVLLGHIQSMGEEDQRTLVALRTVSAGEAASEINRLARRYAGMIAEPKGKAKDYVAPEAPKPPPYVNRGVGQDHSPPLTNAPPVGQPRERDERVGVHPDPKAVAAKKAAFLEKARSGDAALIESLKTSTDAKGLQRALEFLEEPLSPELKNAVTALLAGDTTGELRLAYKGSEIRYKSEREIAALPADQQARAKLANQATANLLSNLTKPQQLEFKTWAELNGLDPKDPATVSKFYESGYGVKVPPTIDLENNILRVYKVAAERLTELAQDPDVAYNLLTKKYSAQSTGTGPQNPSARAAVVAYLDKVLGTSVRRAWANLTHAGEFDTVTNTIRLSIHALDPMSVAYHESLHAFFKQLKDSHSDDIANVLLKASESRHVIDQMTAFFAHEPNVLAQLADREERAAYMYQMWAAGQLTVNAPARSLFQRIAKYIRELMGVWSNDERALHIMEYFNTGEYARNLGHPNAVRRALMEPGRNQAFETAKSFTEPMAHIADAIVSTGSGRMRDTGVPSLIKLADIIKREHTAEGGDQGYIAAARIEGTKRRTAMGETLKSFSKETLDTAMEGLHNGTHSLDANVRDAQDRLKAILRRTKNYMHQAGVDLGDLKADYFPRVWDTHYISKHQQEFLDMLAPYERAGHGSAKSMLNALMSHEGNEFQTETNIPGMQFTKTRLWNFITPQDASTFVTKDLMGTMSSYITQATRRAEWERRLGGGKLEQMFNKARQEGATDDDLKLTTDYLKGVDGTLGDSLNPTARRLMGNMIVYQNVRLLPLAVFSSIVDPVGVMVRGGTLGDAWTTFKRGMSEIPANFGRKTRDDDAAKMAELVGVVDSAMLTHTMGDLYTQGMVGGTAQKINNAFFRFNLMEGLNRSFRVGATEAAAKFMLRHADGLASRHSTRWMNELGLLAGDVKTVNGRMALTTADGLTADQVVRVHAALNQWVDGAVLRPDAADKPVWMNDPHYALISHLKQFVYSFQKTIIDRVVHEAEHGNYSPVMALASYVPIMIAADTAKGIIQGGGDQPEWKKGWDMGDYVGYGVQRAGLLGVGQFGYDVMQNAERGGTGVGALVGPTFEQLGDVITALNGKKQFGPVVLHAMPANALYSELDVTPSPTLGS